MNAQIRLHVPCEKSPSVLSASTVQRLSLQAWEIQREKETRTRCELVTVNSFFQAPLWNVWLLPVTVYNGVSSLVLLTGDSVFFSPGNCFVFASWILFLCFTPVEGLAHDSLICMQGTKICIQIKLPRTKPALCSLLKMLHETQWPFSRSMTHLCSFISPAILLRNLHQIPRRGVIMGLPVSCNQRKQVKDPRGFWQNETGGTAQNRGSWLFRHRSSWFLSVCCLPAVKASLSPSPPLMGSSGFEEIMIHASNWCFFYGGRQKYTCLYWLTGGGWQIWLFPVGSLCGGTCRCQACCLCRTVCLVFYKINGYTVAFSGLLSLMLLRAGLTT